MQPLKTGRLNIRVQEGVNVVRVLWSGVSDEREPSSSLDPYLDRIVTEAGKRAVEVNFCAMEYMNSATVPSLLRFVRSLNAKEIQTKVVYDPTQTFQRTAFSAFKALASVMPHLTVSPAAGGES